MSLIMDVSAASVIGGRNYMEDRFCIAYHRSNTDSSAKTHYVYFGVFDGHGGKEAADYARENLLNNITNKKKFWSKSDKDILDAIYDGFIQTHNEMKQQVLKWPKTPTGLQSTAGTTASIIFIMNNKYYIGHVGDSGISLGRTDGISFLTESHRPDCPKEKERIETVGGKVAYKAGIPRVVWKRPKFNEENTFEEIPFLSLARSLGDLWSYNSQLDTYIVSPIPDVKVIPIQKSDKYLILGSDGLWNVLNKNEIFLILSVADPKIFDIAPAQVLLNQVINKCDELVIKPDNTTIMVIYLNNVNGMIDQKIENEVTFPQHSTSSILPSYFSRLHFILDMSNPRIPMVLDDSTSNIAERIIDKTLNLNELNSDLNTNSSKYYQPEVSENTPPITNLIETNNIEKQVIIKVKPLNRSNRKLNRQIDFSPPSKRLRSSTWSRRCRFVFYRPTTSVMTKSRLRARTNHQTL